MCVLATRVYTGSMEQKNTLKGESGSKSEPWTLEIRFTQTAIHFFIQQRFIKMPSVLGRRIAS